MSETLPPQSTQPLPPSERRTSRQGMAAALGVPPNLLGLVLASIVVSSILAGGIVGFLLGRWYERQQWPAQDAEWLLGAVLSDRVDGVRLTDLYPGGPAYNARLQEGDRLVTIERQLITDAAQARRLLAAYPAGQAVRVEIERDHLIAQYVVTLGVYGPVIELLPTPTPVPPLPPPAGLVGEARLGVYYRMLVPGDPFEVSEGALVITVWPGGPAEQAGLLPGDIITEVDGRQLAQWYSLEDALDAFQAGQTVTLRVWSAGAQRAVRVRLGGG